MSGSRARATGRVRSILAALIVVAGATGCSHIVVLHDPLTAPEHNDLGVAYEAQGRFDLAAREYRRALKLDPHYGRARLNLGNVEAAAGRWTRAEREYRRALADLPGDPDPLNNLAMALLRLGGDLGEAESLAVRAVGLATSHDSLYRATLVEVRAARAARSSAPR
ncbi:MAG: tetratricopeptide repeat protein [Candidatus Eisenbacteria bacterium]